MTVTTHLGLTKPIVGKNVNEEFLQLGDTLDQLDAIIHAQDLVIGGKAPVAHAHAIGDITGLIEALAAKMNASATFKLDSLTDVDGADLAPNGYLLVKTAAGWVPVSAATALGNHNHNTSQINGLDAALANLAASFADYVPINANRVQTVALIGSNPGFELVDTFGKRRGIVFWNSSNGELVIANYDTDGVTALNTLRIPGTVGGELTLSGYKVATEANIGNIYGGNVNQGTVGAVQMLAHASINTALTYGTNYAGSSLRLCSLFGDVSSVAAGISGSAPAGTWQCLGTVSAQPTKYGISLFRRIA